MPAPTSPYKAAQMGPGPPDIAKGHTWSKAALLSHGDGSPYLGSAISAHKPLTFPRSSECQDDALRC